MSGIKKRPLSHTNCIKPTCTSCSNLLLLNIEGMRFITAYINWLILFIVRRVKASAGNLVAKNPSSALYTPARTTQTEDFDIPWMSPSSEKSAFARKRKVHKTGITTLSN